MDALFDLPPAELVDEREVRRGVPRVQRPDRAQLELRTVDLDGLLSADHRARLVWDFVMGLDLAPLYARIRATTDGPGRPPIDPAVLTALTAVRHARERRLGAGTRTPVRRARRVPLVQLAKARAVVLWFALAHCDDGLVALRAARAAQPARATVPV